MGIFHSRGVYLNYPEDDNLEHVLLEGALQNGIAPENVDVIVVTDSGAILGIGDQGVGGVAISVITSSLSIFPSSLSYVILGSQTCTLYSNGWYQSSTRASSSS